MATTVAHAQLIRYDNEGNQLVINLKNTGDDVSISRSSNGNLPSSVSTVQTLANALGALAFKSSLGKSDVGLGSVDNTADANKSVNYASTAGSTPKLTRINHLSTKEELDAFITPNVFQYATVASVDPINNDGIVLSMTWKDSTNYAHQIFIDDNSSIMLQRGRNNGTWTNWVRVIDSSTIGSQSVNYATTSGSANAVAWGNVSGKPSAYTPSSHTHSKSEVGLANVDNTADANKSVKYATSSGSSETATKATHVVDYGNTSAYIDIGYNGSGITGSDIKYIAGYTSGANGSTARIKDISKDALKSWIGLLSGDNILYVSKDTPTVPCIWAKID